MGYLLIRSSPNSLALMAFSIPETWLPLLPPPPLLPLLLLLLLHEPNKRSWLKESPPAPAPDPPSPPISARAQITWPAAEVNVPSSYEGVHLPRDTHCSQARLRSRLRGPATYPIMRPKIGRTYRPGVPESNSSFAASRRNEPGVKQETDRKR
jgi:hypothetical protein